MTLLQSRFETYLLEEEYEETTEETSEIEMLDTERMSFPEGFFSGL